MFSTSDNIQKIRFYPELNFQEQAVPPFYCFKNFFLPYSVKLTGRVIFYGHQTKCAHLAGLLLLRIVWCNRVEAMQYSCCLVWQGD